MKIRNRFLNRVLSWLAVGVLRLLFLTCRLVKYAEEESVDPYEGTGEARHLYCIWHDQVVMIVFSGRPTNMAGLVSGHRDGSYLADAMRLLKIKAVRGSSSKGGARALRELMETAKDLHVAITPDGPRGPRREAKAGIVYLASQSGRKIVPVALTCKRMWRIRGSWTDMMLPLPFTTIYAVAVRGVHVPPNLERDGISEYTKILQAEMHRAEQLVRNIAAGQSPDEEQSAETASQPHRPAA